MFVAEYTVILTFLCVAAVYGQIPPGYVCVPAGSCTSVPGGGGIDIRIVTPGNINPCPPGQILCLAGTTTPIPAQSCGTRSVTGISTADGYATPGAYPWQAYLVNQTGYCGSGVLINANTVLTVAHKVYLDSDSPGNLGVYMGVYNAAQLGMRYAVARVLVHSNYSPTILWNDIALLRLSAAVSPLPQQYINTACLPAAGQSFVGYSCWVSGWGQTQFGVRDAPTTQQKQVGVTIVNYDTCYASMSQPSLLGQNAAAYLDRSGEICAGGQAQRDACTEDGGSPLVCLVNGAYTIAGLVTWGKGCGQAGVYGVYVNVPYYYQWIQNSIGTLNG